MPEVVDAPFDETARTVLMYAVSSTSSLVEMLIKAGADVNRRDAQGRPVWDFALTSGPQSIEIWRLLIQAGLDVHSRDPGGKTPLIYVCAAYLDPASNDVYIQSHLSIVRLLIEAGAAVNVADQYNVTPLEAAKSARNDRVVRMLLKAGADPNPPRTDV
jgi:hypothetical protein